MNSSLSFSGSIQPLKNFVHRFHFVLFVLIIAGGLALAIFLLNNLISESQQEVPVSTKATFDTATIQRLEELRTRDDSQNTQIVLPPGRINPFVE